MSSNDNNNKNKDDDIEMMDEEKEENNNNSILNDDKRNESTKNKVKNAGAADDDSAGGGDDDDRTLLTKKTSISSSASSSSSYEIPWVEKYRPKSLDDVIGNDDVVVRLRAIADDGNMPNLILCGPPGTGKTTSIHALARQLLGGSSSYYKHGVLELNASDARGIDVVRNQIKSFAMNKIHLPKGRHKIIILDEADSMTTNAQQALRRTMEIYSNTTRFCLACNVSTKIIEAIQSRAAILRYTRLSNEQILHCLFKICSKENISYTNDGLEAILFTAEGDMRNAINNLQAATSLTRSRHRRRRHHHSNNNNNNDDDDDDHNGGGMITQNIVYKVCDQPHPKTVTEIIEFCLKGDTQSAVSLMTKLYNCGYAASDIMGTIFKVIKVHAQIPEALKLEYLRDVGFTHMRVTNHGMNTLLQLLGLISRLSQKCQIQQEDNKK